MIDNFCSYKNIIIFYELLNKIALFFLIILESKLEILNLSLIRKK
ncbi:hypothetical protein EV201_1418 [Ancylomarina subtilis]|uniref:Uncharacterized protein n=1 Tax=Ancylomarina subtilis TaxID=1639035 RepID=A0A4Q7VKP0_9BACT|nr:hypothetical protein EV201_1418 [Ancylomarina subtilis]